MKDRVGGWRRNWSAKRWAFIVIRLTVAAFVLDVYLALIPPGRHGRDLIVLAATTGVLAGLVWQSKRRRRRHHQARHATYEQWDAGTFTGYLTRTPPWMCRPFGP